jgi:hypothetical protein
MNNDQHFNGYDIFVVGYPSSFFRSSYTVDELVEVLRRDLDDAGVFTTHKHVYFLCHSMGGLVVRGYLTRYRNRASQVPMIYFFSTPTTGAEMATIGSLLARNRQMGALLPVHANEYLSSIQKDWLAAQFPIASYCAYETQDTYGIRVVGESSATNLCNRRLDPIDADHLNIVKPSDMPDAPYISFRNALEEMRPEPAPIAHSPEDPLHGWLTFGREPLPSNKCTEQYSGDGVFMFVGNNIDFISHFPNIVLRIGNDDLLVVDRREGKVAVNAKVFSSDGKIVAEIKENEFFINPNNYFRRERPNTHSLAVYDQQDRKVLDIDYFNSRGIRLDGIFSDPRHEVVFPPGGFYGNCMGNTTEGEYWFK